ncbi:MAG: CPBP family intramembrane metalloprotease [Chloroflexi bacterium]|nr:CPBP family intramembrane metalloprotease [Chloroflexota bacterium]
MENNKKHLYIFLSLAFGISWLTALVIYLTGGLVNSPVLIPGTGISLALILLASVYMWGPALANIITRLITKEGKHDLWLKPNLKTSWKYWLLGWFGPGLLTILGAIVFFSFFPNTFDSSLNILPTQLTAAGVPEGSINPWPYVAIQTATAFLIAPVLNFIATFGEEFGWRAYLLPKLRSLGDRKALILSGLIWGVWHWPVIAMGHNYGLDYPGFPWLGLLAMVWFCVSGGVFIGWLALKSESVWPAVIAHGALNGIAAISMFFVKPPVSMLLGPTPAGIIGMLPFTLVSILILLKSKN